MNTNVNLSAPLGVLAFLGTAFLLGLACLILLHAIKTRKPGRARAIGLAALSLLGLYLVTLLLFSIFSREQVLARGAEKHFCEIDCHLAYSIADVRKLKTLGEPPGEATAQGIFYVVKIRTRFDETTINLARGDALLTPNSRVVTVSDEQGNSYSISPAGERALEASEGSGTPLETALRPGEAYTTELAFDLPADIKNPTLLIREGGFETHFIIGHENSFWHRKTRFRLE